MNCRSDCFWLARIWSLAASWVVLVLFAGCSRHGASSEGGGVSPGKMNLKRSVELAKAEQRPLDYYVETVGVLEAEGFTEIAAGVAGVVDQILFREGDKVDRNTVLAKIDQRRYVADADVARANEKRAEASVALAKDVANRARVAGAGLSEEERTKAILTLRVAEAELQAAKASRVRAENHLDRSQVRAPYAGRINQRRVSIGSYVEDKTPIATMANLSRIRLVGWVPETASARVRELMAEQEERVRTLKITLPLGSWLAGPLTPIDTGGLTLPARLAGLHLLQKDYVPSDYDPEFTLPMALPNRTFRARIFYLSTVASPETHMFECKAEVDTRGVDVELRPGYAARIRFPLRSNPDACVIPEEAVRASERGFIAFVPVERVGKDGSKEWIAKARTLELGYRSPGWVEVRSGITPGESIIRRGAEALEDGTPIRF